MSNLPSKPFSSGMEYEWFCEQYCERCTKCKLREDGFPEFPEKGGCVIRDALEYARFDINRYPSEWIRELRSAEDGSIITWHYCTRFSNPDYEGEMVPYFQMMKKALFKTGEQNE